MQVNLNMLRMFTIILTISAICSGCLPSSSMSLTAPYGNTTADTTTPDVANVSPTPGATNPEGTGQTISATSTSEVEPLIACYDTGLELEPADPVAVSWHGAFGAVGHDDTVYLFDLAEHKELWHAAIGSQISSLSFSPDSQTVLVGTIQHFVSVRDILSGQEYDVFTDCTPDATVSDSALSPSNDILICAAGSAEKGTITLWSVNTHVLLADLRAHIGQVNRIVWSPGGTIFASAGLDNSIFLWEPGQTEPKSVLSVSPITVKVLDIMFHPEGRLLAVGMSDRTVVVLDTVSNQTVEQMRGFDHTVRSVAWAHSGRYLAGGAFSGQVRIWDFEANGWSLVGDCGDASVESMAFTADDTLLISASVDGFAYWTTGP